MAYTQKDLTVIAITGGPCSGKSSLLSIAKEWLENRGCFVGILSETPTELINAGIQPWAPWEEKVDFQRELLLFGLKREEHYARMMRRINTSAHLVLLCDRGVVDARAYIDSRSFDAILDEFGLNIGVLFSRYDVVVHLVTAADGAEEHYTLENNAARTETPEVACDIDKKTQAAWVGHPHHFIIDNSTGFQEKIGRALKTFSRVLPVPEPSEIERKFAVVNYNEGMVPDGAVASRIVQTYLLGDDAEGERRVRERTCLGAVTYTYTTKRPTENRGERIESERIIEKEEYEKLLLEMDPDTETIHKVRFTFLSGSHQMELDVYQGPLDGLVILEVELRDITESILLPEGFELEEVTEDKIYSNRSLASKWGFSFDRSVL